LAEYWRKQRSKFGRGKEVIEVGIRKDWKKLMEPIFWIPLHSNGNYSLLVTPI
jgi:hypothetical protein